MKITLNGEPREVAEGTCVGELVDLVTADRSRVAVERNLAIVKREAYDETGVEPGDVVEVVALVGGG